MMNEFNDIYSPEQFRTIGHELIERLAEYLRDSMSADVPVIDWMPPEQMASGFMQSLPRQPRMTLDQWLGKLDEAVLEKTLRVHHPRNLGHQVAPPLPLAALCDLVAALTNQAMAVYETGPSATLIEQQVIAWLSRLLGFEHASGVLTSGGAQANLTALLAARQVMAGADVWKAGVATIPGLCILASEHAHYSISRAAGIMGLGTDAVIAVAADAGGSMDITALRTAYESVKTRGLQPFAVVATAGCTPTGSIDPLHAVADFCAVHQLWMHVDGAHGASGLLSERHRGALGGIECADSVIWDGHKLLCMPATVSAVLFRNPQHSYAAFAQEASYLFQGGSDEAEAYNTSYRTLECTKRMMGLKLWAAFVLYGSERLGQLVEHVYASAGKFARLLEAADDFELLLQPQTNIVCFRYTGPEFSSSAMRSELQAALRSRLVESGAFHLTQTRVRGEIWLRTTIMNPLTREEDLSALMDAIRAMAPSVLNAS